MQTVEVGGGALGGRVRLRRLRRTRDWIVTLVRMASVARGGMGGPSQVVVWSVNCGVSRAPWISPRHGTEDGQGAGSERAWPRWLFFENCKGPTCLIHAHTRV